MEASWGSGRRTLGEYIMNLINPEIILGILEIESHFTENIGVKFLRPEAKLLIILKQSGSLSIKEAMITSGLSYRGFYILLSRLVAQELIRVEVDENDRRVRKILLSRPI